MLLIILQLLLRNQQNVIARLLGHDFEVLGKGLEKDGVACAGGSSSKVTTSHSAEIDVVLVLWADVNGPDGVPFLESLDHDSLGVVDATWGVGEADLWRDLVSLRENRKVRGGLRMQRSSRGTRQHQQDECRPVLGSGCRLGVSGGVLD